MQHGRDNRNRVFVHPTFCKPYEHHGNHSDRNANNSSDRKSTRLNSSHVSISYAVFCLKKKQTASSRASSCLRPSLRDFRTMPVSSLPAWLAWWYYGCLAVVAAWTADDSGRPANSAS